MNAQPAATVLEVCSHRGRSAGHAGARWLEGVEAISCEEGLLPDWLARVKGGSSGSIYLHPDLVLQSAEAAPLVFVQRHETSGGVASALSLAALAPKTRRVSLLPGLPWSWSLRGRRLV